MTLSQVSAPGRIAEPGEAVSAQELQLAARNHGMPLEALRYDVTPAGLHYLLVHYDIPFLDAATWQLEIGGAVRRPLHLTLAALKAMPRRTVRVTIECAGNGRAQLDPRPVSQPWLVEAVGTADWTGVSLRAVLAAAGPSSEAVDVVFTGADHGIERGVEQDYQRGLSLDEAMHDDVLLAYAMNGADLLPQHGFPMRLVVPGWYGMAHVKWLTQIDVLDRPYDGYQNSVAYRLRQDPVEPGRPVERIQPRALIEPPGFPDFMSRTRIVRPGPVTLSGRAWCGSSPVASVDVSTDGGTTWLRADLEPSHHRWSWLRWQFDWVATAGSHEIVARATAVDGTTQPDGQPWNRGGFANNAVHRVPVECVPDGG